MHWSLWRHIMCKILLRHLVFGKHKLYLQEIILQASVHHDRNSISKNGSFFEWCISEKRSPFWWQGIAIRTHDMVEV